MTHISIHSIDPSLPAPKHCDSTVHNPADLPNLPIAEYKAFLTWSPTLTLRNDKYKVLKRPVKKSWQNNLSTLFRTLPLVTSAPPTLVHPSLPPMPSLGLGFAYNETHPFVCVDLDNLEEENLALAKELDSYTELSPSHKGYHIIISLTNLKDKDYLLVLFGNGKRDKTSERDLYIANGFVTITNNLVPGYSQSIRTFDVDDLISILSRYFKPDTASSIDEITSKKTPEDMQQLKRLNKDQVLALLNKVDVKALESNIFDRLRNDEHVLLSPECTEEAREPWLTIGQAIHHNFDGSLTGYQLWRDWSAKGNKFNQEDCESVWKSFKDQVSPVTIYTLVKLVRRQFAYFEHRTAKGQVLPTIQNFRALVDFLGVIPTFNIFSKQISVSVPDHKAEEWGIDAKTIPPSVVASLIQSEIFASNIPITPGAFNLQQIKLYMQAVASTNITNPIKDYFVRCGEKWDKRDYITPLMRTIVTPPGHLKYRSSYHQFVRKWLLQVAAAACHDPSMPPRLNRVLIFLGPQNIGKTKWVESLFPRQLRSFCAADKDLKLGKHKTESTKLTMELTSTLICNINEIDRLFRSSTFSEFKAFLDQTQDQVVLPYGDAPTLMTRRTVFIGSTNEKQFLTDLTGNRRIEIIEATHMDFEHDIPIDQLWGQIYNLYMSGEKWWLDAKAHSLEELQAIEHRDVINAKHMAFKSDSVALELDDYFDASVPYDPATWRKYTLKDIKAIIGLVTSGGRSTATKVLKDTITAWRAQIPQAPAPYEGAGPRARVFYWMPPLRDVVPTEAFEAYEERVSQVQ